MWRVVFRIEVVQLDVCCSVSPPVMRAQRRGVAPPRCHAIILSARLQGAVISLTAGGILSVSLGGVCGRSLWFHSPEGCHFSNICFPADSHPVSVYHSHTDRLVKRETVSFRVMGSKLFEF